MAQIRLLLAAIAAMLISHISQPVTAGEYPGLTHPIWSQALKDGAKVSSTIVEDVVGPFTNGVIRIKDNTGGKGPKFWFAGREAARRADITRIEVSGRCSSSCVIFIDAARSKVCLHARTVLGFHLGSIDAEKVRPERRHLIPLMDIPPLADDVMKIVAAHGTLTKKMMGIRGSEFTSIWPACGTKPPRDISKK